MRRGKTRITGKVGFPPGTLTHVGTTYSEKSHIRCMEYDSAGADVREAETWQELQPFSSKRSVTWIEVCGIHDVAAVEQIGRQFSIHPLVLEDVLNTTQRPKFEEYDEYLFILMRVPFSNERVDAASAAPREIRFEQVSLIFGEGWIISFTESDRELFSLIRDHIINGKGRVRGQSSDYLAYSLLDLIVDHFFTVLEDLGESIEFLDEELVRDPGPALLQQIHFFKRQLLYLHKAVWPVREIIGTFERCTSKICRQDTVPYLHDVYDHIIQVLDMVETYRDLVSGMLDIYLSSISYRLNEVMKVLTIISTLFIPLTFIAGVYGMNFENMPELKWEYGYYGIWVIMLLIAWGMLRYFHRKRWL